MENYSRSNRINIANHKIALTAASTIAMHNIDNGFNDKINLFLNHAANLNDIAYGELKGLAKSCMTEGISEEKK